MWWGLHFLTLDLGGPITAVEVMLCAFQGQVLPGKTASAWPFGDARPQAVNKGKSYMEGISGDSYH